MIKCKEAIRLLGGVLCVLLALALVLVNASIVFAAQSKITLTFVTFDVNRWKQITDLYRETHPNIDFKLVSGASDKILTMAAGNVDMDIIQNNVKAGVIGLAKDGLLEPLDPYLEGDNFKKQYWPFDPKDIMYNGKIYVMPLWTAERFVIYNVDMFDECGVDAPGKYWTYNDMRSLALKITNRYYGKNIFGLCNSWKTWEPMHIMYGVQVGADLMSGNLEPFGRGTRLWAEMNLKDKSLLGDWDGLGKGQAAMCIISDFYLGRLRQYEKEGKINFKWDVAGMPSPPELKANSHISIAEPWQWLSISSKSKHKEEAWEFLKWVGGEEGAKILADAKLIEALSAYRFPGWVEYFGRRWGLNPKRMWVFTDVTLRILKMHPKLPEAELAWIAWSRKAINGEISVEEAVRNAEREIKAMLNIK